MVNKFKASVILTNQVPENRFRRWAVTSWDTKQQRWINKRHIANTLKGLLIIAIATLTYAFV